jgi:hypothetical protein
LARGELGNDLFKGVDQLLENITVVRINLPPDLDRRSIHDRKLFTPDAGTG